MLNELLREMYEVAMGDNPKTVSDVSLDALSNLCVALVRRDPQMGELLVRKLEARAESRAGIAPAERDQHLDLSERMRKELEIPPVD